MGVGPLFFFLLRSKFAPCLCLVLSAVAGTPLHAQSFTITNGQTATTQQTIGPGGFGLIEALGAINFTGGTAVVSSGDNVNVNNAGSITATTGATHNGVNINNFSTVHNSGTITASQYAIYLFGNNIIVNTGTLTAATAIYADGNGNTVSNFGNIVSQCCGINLLSNNTVTNRGTISSSLGDGISADSGNTINNWGTITARVDAINISDNNVVNNLGILNATTEDGIDAGNGNTLVNRGTINAGEDGIFAVDNNTITNFGSITASRVGILGEDNNVVTNDGNIVARFDGIYGEDGNTIINNGTIRTLVDNGILVEDNNTVTNNGTIISVDDGIDAEDGNTIVNNGTINSGDDGIDVDGTSTVTNRGTIVSTGDDGVDIEGSGTVLVNFGSITGFEGGVVVDAAVNGSTIINAGSIINSQGPSQPAFELRGGAGDHLIFQESPLTVGTIIFGVLGGAANGTGDTVEFRVAGGRSLDVSFNTLPDNVLHDSSIQSTVVDRTNNRVIYVDPTGFSANTVWLDGLARSIFDAIASANDGSGTNSSTNAYFLQTGDASATSDAQPYRAWASGFTTASRQKRSGVNGDLTGVDGGAVFGFDADISAQTRMGLFGGVSHGRMNVENDHQSITTTGGYLGVYADWTDEEIFANFTLFGGFSEQDSKRDVANNLVVGGIETASASYSGAFISPALTLGRQIAEFSDGTPLLGSVRVHYSGMWLDGYTESGVTNPVTVGDREIHRFGARAQLSFPEDVIAADGGAVRVDRRAGLDYAFSPNSQNVSGSVAGLPLNFEAEFDNKGPAGFVGFDFTRVLEGGDRILKLGSEARVTTDGSVEYRASLTFKSFF